MKTYNEYIKDWKENIRSYYSKVSVRYDVYEKMNHYFYRYRRHILQKIIPPQKKVLDLGCGGGENLAFLRPEKTKGLDFCPEMIEKAKKRFSEMTFECRDADDLQESDKGFDYVLAVNLLLEVPDIFRTLNRIKGIMSRETRLVIMNHGSTWEVFFRLYTRFQNRRSRIFQHWLTSKDYENLFQNCGLKIVTKSTEVFFPFSIPLLSNMINRIFPLLPVIKHWGMVHVYVLASHERRSEIPPLSCSVIIPCKNEEDNVPLVLPRIPQMGERTEIIFVDDRSTDATREKMELQKKASGNKIVKIVKGDGKGKGAACQKGFENASGDVLMILDADLTVVPEVLADFFQIMQNGYAEFINGSRNVYRLEKDSMRFFNQIGNILFARIFSWLLNCRINDTLCGTKVFFRRDLMKVMETRAYLRSKDVWGDFDLLFTASRHNLVYTELPVHYFPRTFGDTKMTKRLKNAFIMLKYCWIAFKKMKW